MWMGLNRVVVRVGRADAVAETFVVAAVHLPTDAANAGVRERVLQKIVATSGDEDKLLIVGDMNAKDEEIKELCKGLGVHEARYAGVSWGAPGNRFYEEVSQPKSRSLGLRLDRVLFGSKLWAESHLVGQGPVFFDGEEFYLSDHFGVLAYVDVSDAYASRAKQDVVATQARRGHLVRLREHGQEKELVEVKARRQLGREEQALARRRTAERDREQFQRTQRRGAKQRQERRRRLRAVGLGIERLFGENVASVPASGFCEPCSPSDVGILPLNGLPSGSWATTANFPRSGMRNLGNTCYVNSVTQVLVRTPAMLEWICRHNADGCPLADTSCVLFWLGCFVRMVSFCVEVLVTQYDVVQFWLSGAPRWVKFSTTTISMTFSNSWRRSWIVQGLGRSKQGDVVHGMGCS